MRIAILHPGTMGASIAAALQINGHELFWIPQDRSQATALRADALSLKALAGLQDLCHVHAVISICPPHAAAALASAVAATSFQGLYLDANAIAPLTAQQIAGIVGAGYVDGGIIGPPATRAGTTRLYLSGNQADSVQQWFQESPLATIVIGADPVSASALKMCYAAYTKGSAALVLGVRALAQANGITEALLAEWAISQPGLARRSEMIAQGSAAKAWRFAGEKDEIAATFAAAELPGEFHQGAAKLYRRLEVLKNSHQPSLEQVLTCLLGTER